MQQAISKLQRITIRSQILHPPVLLYLLVVVHYIVMEILTYITATFNLIIVIGHDHVFKVLTPARIAFLVFLPIIILLSFVWRVRNRLFVSLGVAAWAFCMLGFIALMSDLWTLKAVFDGLSGVCYLALMIYSIMLIIITIRHSISGVHSA